MKKLIWMSVAASIFVIASLLLSWFGVASVVWALVPADRLDRLFGLGSIVRNSTVSLVLALVIDITFWTVVFWMLLAAWSSLKQRKGA